ncbi:rod shape-determining protein, partial [uncultured Dubosiella sp.]
SRLPVDTQKDIMTRGIVCSGGFVTITGMRRRLQELIGCPVYLTDQPLYTIITGLEIVLSQMA